MPILFQMLWANSLQQVDNQQTATSAHILRYLFGFPENSAGWLVYSSEHLQCIVVTCDAYFDKAFSSALAFDSKPFARAIPIHFHLDPNELQTSDNSEHSIFA